MYTGIASGQRFKHPFLTHGESRAMGQTPLLFLHGFLGDKLSWQYCIVPLSRHGQVYAIDLPGHGQNEILWNGPMKDMAVWLEDAIDALHLMKCHVIAHSLGAWIALQAALRGSARIASLSLVACAGLDSRLDLPLLKGALSANNESRALDFARALAGQDGEAVKRLAHHHQNMLHTGAQNLALHKLLEEMESSVLNADPPPTDWPSITVPVHFFWCENDCIVPLPHSRALPKNASISLSKQGGHIPHILAPGWLTLEIGRFLTSIQANSA